METPAYDGVADWYESYLGNEGYRVVEQTMLDLLTVADVAPVFAEIARVARERVVIVAVHPCFAGPTAQLDPATWTVTVTPGYLETHVRHVGQGVRARVGVRHVPLHELLTKLATAGLRTQEVVETGPGPIPLWLGIRSRPAPG